MFKAAMAPDQVSALVTIINLVRSGTANTRPALGRASMLGRSIVTQRVEQAIQLGYLADAELGPSTGGRAPRVLRFRAEQGRFLAIQFGAMHVDVAVLDLDLQPRRQVHADWDITEGPLASLEFVADALESMLHDDGAAPVWGVAIGVPGPVEFTTGRPVAPPIMPGWDGFDIRGWFEDRFGAPVFVDNDVNLLALGELEELGLGRDEALIFVKVGTGIGAGVTSAGRIHRGANGAAGDVGHIAVTDRPVVCRCGQRGCLEAVAGGWALARDGEEAAVQQRSPYLTQAMEENGQILPADVVAGARNGDAACVELIALSGRTVGEMLASVVSFFNPSIVAIGGSIAASGDLFLSAVRQTVYRRSLPLATRDLRIVAATASAEGMVGAGRLVAERVFDSESMAAWVCQGGPRERIAAVYAAPSGPAAP